MIIHSSQFLSRYLYMIVYKYEYSMEHGIHIKVHIRFNNHIWKSSLQPKIWINTLQDVFKKYFSESYVGTLLYVKLRFLWFVTLFNDLWSEAVSWCCKNHHLRYGKDFGFFSALKTASLKKLDKIKKLNTYLV